MGCGQAAAERERATAAEARAQLLVAAERDKLLLLQLVHAALERERGARRESEM